MDIVRIFGGWPNALQGVVSALLSGAVAAGAAYLVVRWTASRERELARLQQTRDQLIRVAISTTTSLQGLPDSRPWRDDLELAFLLNSDLRLAAALVAAADHPFAQSLQERADSVAQVVSSWERDPELQSDGAALRRFNQLYDVIRDVHEIVINWLGDVQPLTRRTRSV